MTHADFHRAILDEPDDNLVRLVFADWLEEHGEAGRALWMRLSIEVSAARTRLAMDWNYDLSHELHRLECEADNALRRCWPETWRLPFGTKNYTWGGRGLIRLWLPSRSALRRLGGAAWLPAACARGWIGEIRIRDDADYESAVATAWRRNASGCPLAATVSCSPSHSPPGWLFAHPELHDIEFRVAGTSQGPNWCRINLAGCHQLRNAAIDAKLFETSTTEVVKAIWSAPQLRHLTILALPRDENRSIDSMLDAIVGHPTLRQLRIVRGNAATPEAIHSLRQAMPHLHIKTTY